MARIFISSTVAGVLLLSSFTQAQQTTAPKAATNAHQHAAHGPHKGDLLEIGKHDYHAELCLDEQRKQIVVYLLDRELKNYVAIDAPALSINLKLAGKPAQIKLPAMPQKADRSGWASCFGATSPELMTALHDPKSDARLSLRIGDKSFVVKVVHNHDHTGHNHATKPTTNAPAKR